MATRHLLLILLSLVTSWCRATPTVVDFEDVLTGTYYANYESKGMVFSPNCHYDINNNRNSPSGPVAAPYGNWFGSDISGCGENSNPDYLGPAAPSGAVLYIRRADGGLFDLTSFVFAAVSDDIGGLRFFSDAGELGNFEYTGGNFVEYAPAGDQWKNLSWLLVRLGSPGAPVGFDNFTVDLHVPEPAMGLLLGLALGLMAWARRGARPRRA